MMTTPEQFAGKVFDAPSSPLAEEDYRSPANRGVGQNPANMVPVHNHRQFPAHLAILEKGSRSKSFDRSAVSLKPRYVMPFLLAACAAGSMPGVPHAVADEPMPPVGQSPVEAIEDFEAEGYIVAINWTRGYPEVPLSECTLIAIHNPDGSGPKTNTTVYLDISCPPGNFD